MTGVTVMFAGMIGVAVADMTDATVAGMIGVALM